MQVKNKDDTGQQIIFNAACISQALKNSLAEIIKVPV